MTKKKALLFLAIIFLIGSFLRLWQLDSIPPGLYHDEAINGNNALEAIETNTYKWFYTDNNGREGLYINLLAIPLSFFGNESWAIRVLSAFFGILTVLGLFLLTKRLFNTRVALFSSFFLATSFWHILFSRIGFRAVMAPFFLTWGFYFLFLNIKKEKNQKKSSKTRKDWLFTTTLSGLLFGLGFHSYIAYRIAPLLLVVPFAILWKRGQKKIIAVFLISTFIAGLPLGLYFLENPQDFFGRTSQISVFSSQEPVKNILENIAKTMGMLFFVGDFNWRHNLAGAPALWWPVAFLFLVGALFGFKKIISKITRPSKAIGYWMLFVWFSVMMLPVIISNEGLPHALRAIILIPPIMIFAGLGLELIISKIEKWLDSKTKQNPSDTKQLLRIRKKFTILLFVFLFSLASHSYIQYFIKWGNDIQTYHAFNGRFWDIGKYLQNLPASPAGGPNETKKYVIVNAGGVLVNDIPMPAQTIMFATNDKEINYILPEQINSIKCPESCFVVTMEPNSILRDNIKKQIPDLKISIKPGFEALIK